MAALGSNHSLLEVNLAENLIGKQETQKVRMRPTRISQQGREQNGRSSAHFETQIQFLFSATCNLPQDPVDSFASSAVTVEPALKVDYIYSWT